MWYHLKWSFMACSFALALYLILSNLVLAPSRLLWHLCGDQLFFSPSRDSLRIRACHPSLWIAGSVSFRPRCAGFITWPHAESVCWKRKPINLTQPSLEDLHWCSHFVFVLPILHIHNHYDTVTTERSNTQTTVMCCFIIKTNIKMNTEIQTMKHINGGKTKNNCNIILMIAKTPACRWLLELCFLLCTLWPVRKDYLNSYKYFQDSLGC